MSSESIPSPTNGRTEHHSSPDNGSDHSDENSLPYIPISQSSNIDVPFGECQSHTIEPTRDPVVSGMIKALKLNQV